MSCKHQEGDPTCKTKNPAEMRRRAREMSAKWDPPQEIDDDYDWTWDNEEKALCRKNARVYVGGETYPWKVFNPPMTGTAPNQGTAIEETKKIDGWRGRCPDCGEFYAEDGDTEEHTYCKDIWESPGKIRPGQEAFFASRAAMNDTPDPTEYDVIKTEEVGRFLLMEVQYPSCAACSYEGRKLLVFSGTTREDALKWKKIDPHFRDPAAQQDRKESPPPRSRFPATQDGWGDARKYARMLGGA